MTVCQSLTRRGKACKSPARKGADFCISHDPAFAEQQAENRVAGGIASGQARRILDPIELDFVGLHHPASIQGLLEVVLRLELLGKLPPTRARILVRILSLAVRNWQRPSRIATAADVEHDLDPGIYGQTVDEFKHYLADILYTANSSDMDRRGDEVIQQSSLRTQRFRDEDDWQRAPYQLRPPKRLTSAEAWKQWQDTPPPPFIPFADDPDPLDELQPIIDQYARTRESEIANRES